MAATAAVSGVKEAAPTTGVVAESMTTKCYLNDLSAEARAKIWELVLVERPSVFIAIGTISQRHLNFTGVVTGVDISKKQQVIRLPGILQTSRQIRAEALPVFLAQNTFNFNLHNTIVFGKSDELFDGPFKLGVLTTHFNHLRKVALHFSIGPYRVRVELDGGEVDLSVGRPGYGPCDEVTRSQVEAIVFEALPCGGDIGAAELLGSLMGLLEETRETVNRPGRCCRA